MQGQRGSHLVHTHLTSSISTDTAEHGGAHSTELDLHQARMKINNYIWSGYCVFDFMLTYCMFSLQKRSSIILSMNIVVSLTELCALSNFFQFLKTFLNCEKLLGQCFIKMTYLSNAFYYVLISQYILKELNLQY